MAGRFNSGDPNNGPGAEASLLGLHTQDAQDARDIIKAGFMAMVRPPSGAPFGTDNFQFAYGVLSMAWKLERNAAGQALTDSNDGTHTIGVWTSTATQPQEPAPVTLHDGDFVAPFSVAPIDAADLPFVHLYQSGIRYRFATLGTAQLWGLTDFAKVRVINTAQWQAIPQSGSQIVGPPPLPGTGTGSGGSGSGGTGTGSGGSGSGGTGTGSGGSGGGSTGGGGIVVGPNPTPTPQPVPAPVGTVLRAGAAIPRLDDGVPMYRAAGSAFQTLVTQGLGNVVTSTDGFDGIVADPLAGFNSDVQGLSALDQHLVDADYPDGQFRSGNIDPIVADVAPLITGGDAILNAPLDTPPQIDTQPGTPTGSGGGGSGPGDGNPGGGGPGEPGSGFIRYGDSFPRF